MRIAIIAPLPERIPPKKYGGTERVIYHLVEELVKKGHDVTLFASGDSQTSAKLISVVPKALREMSNASDIYGFNVHSLLNMGLAYSMQEQFDVIHDHNAHMGLPTANIATTPVVMTWHGPYTEDMTKYFSMLNKPHLVSISRSQAARAPSLRFAGTVYNGLTMDTYPFSPTHQGYFLYVGRIDPEKGVHHAMDAAIQTNKKFVIAAKADEHLAHVRSYMDNEILPRLSKYPHLLSWVGEVDEEQRNSLMKNAAGLLHAVTWPEPFGLTLIEAMACGCPVIGFRDGAIPELVKDGVTGFVVDDVAGMAAAIERVDTIDRAACRTHSLTNFSAKRMADGYEAIYNKVAKLQPTIVQYIPYTENTALKRRM